MDWKAIPNRPSGGKSLASKPVEYWVAAPSVCGYAYDVPYEHFAANEKKNNLAPHTIWPLTITTSVYSSPLTDDPSP
jgi:hypothetical protein